MSRETDWQSVIKLADRLEPEARRAFLDAVIRLRDQVDVEKIAAAVAKGHTLTAALLVDPDLFRADLEPLVAVQQKAFLAGGQQAADTISELVDFIRFDVTNPYAVSVAQEAAGRLITAISAETRAAIQSVIVRAYTEGLTRRETSAIIRPLIGLNERQAMAVINYRFGLLESGVDPDRIATLADRYAAKLLKQRAATIGRTEIMGTSNGGQHALWQQAIERKLLDPEVERKWVVTPDDRLCRFCQAMAGQKQKLHHDFVSPLNGRHVRIPPLHPNCRCVLVLIIRALRRVA